MKETVEQFLARGGVIEHCPTLTVEQIIGKLQAEVYTRKREKQPLRDTQEQQHAIRA